MTLTVRSTRKAEMKESMAQAMAGWFDTGMKDEKVLLEFWNRFSEAGGDQAELMRIWQETNRTPECFKSDIDKGEAISLLENYGLGGGRGSEKEG